MWLHVRSGTAESHEGRRFRFSSENAYIRGYKAKERRRQEERRDVRPRIYTGTRHVQELLSQGRQGIGGWQVEVRWRLSWIVTANFLRSRKSNLIRRTSWSISRSQSGNITYKLGLNTKREIVLRNSGFEDVAYPPRSCIGTKFEIVKCDKPENRIILLKSNNKKHEIQNILRGGLAGQCIHIYGLLNTLPAHCSLTGHIFTGLEPP
jgi:hypothetical protein